MFNNLDPENGHETTAYPTSGTYFAKTCRRHQANKQSKPKTEKQLLSTGKQMSWTNKISWTNNKYWALESMDSKDVWKIGMKLSKCIFWMWLSLCVRGQFHGCVLHQGCGCLFGSWVGCTLEEHGEQIDMGTFEIFAILSPTHTVVFKGSCFKCSSGPWGLWILAYIPFLRQMLDLPWFDIWLHVFGYGIWDHRCFVFVKWNHYNLPCFVCIPRSPAMSAFMDMLKLSVIGLWYRCLRKELVFWASLDHATQQQKLLLSPWFGALKAYLSKSPFLSRSVFVTDTSIDATYRFLSVPELLFSYGIRGTAINSTNLSLEVVHTASIGRVSARHEQPTFALMAWNCLPSCTAWIGRIHQGRNKCHNPDFLGFGKQEIRN